MESGYSEKGCSLVWVRIPDLPVEFYSVEALGSIGNLIGKTIKIDRSTSIHDKGGFARICVEVDLHHKPLLPAFNILGEEKQIVYEGLHLVCFGCGKYGHEEHGCPFNKDTRGLVREETDGMNDNMVKEVSNDYEGKTDGGGVADEKAPAAGKGKESGSRLGLI